VPAPNPNHLLEQAERLLDPLPSETERWDADLRRAISAAYYALFHFISTQCCERFPFPSVEKYVVSPEGATHQRIVDLCYQVTRTPRTKKPLKDLLLPPDFFGEIAKFATTFIDLQTKRNLADYDPAFSSTPAELSIIDAARDAMNSFSRAAGEQRIVFLTLLLC
jgi:hypothetical protein